MKIRIAGAGYAVPETVIDNKLLCDLGIGLDDGFAVAIKERRTSLSLNYIRTTKNVDPKIALQVACSSPTDLGSAAVEMALARAGIGPDEIGLVIGDCATPWETIPAEATRIARAWGVRVPAYDVYGGGAALSFFLCMFSKWKPERMPKYILVVSTHTPTQRVHYGSGPAASIAGDGAAAMVLTCEERKGLLLSSSAFRRHPCRGIALSQFGSLVVGARELSETCVSEAEWLRERLAGGKHASFQACLLPQSGILTDEQWIETLQVAEVKPFSSVTYFGNRLAGSGLGVLAEHWEELSALRSVAVCETGTGAGTGFVCLEAVE